MAEDQPYAYLNESRGHCHGFTGLDWVLRVGTEEVRSHLLLLHQVSMCLCDQVLVEDHAISSLTPILRVHSSWLIDQAHAMVIFRDGKNPLCRARRIEAP